MLSNKYYLAKYKHLQDRLNNLPKIVTGYHGTIPVIRNYNKDNTYSEHLLSSKIGKQLLSDANDYQSVKNKLKALRRKYKINSHCVDIAIKPMVHNVLSLNKVLPIKPCANPMSNEYEYVHKGIKMRSRFEVHVAKILDSFELEYYYEPELIVNGKIVYPDFLIALPELGVAFLIECLGRTNDLGYLYKNSDKLMNYFNIGLEINKNLLIFCGDDKYMPPDEYLSREIINIINNITTSSVEYVSK